RILTVETILSEAVIIADDGPAGVVHVGSKVKVQEDANKPELYSIVGAAEANPAKGLISNESPLGKSLLGRKVGDEVKVNAPAGMLSFRVIAIE
ncbi:MAG: GreA/GreB family elongation factor, partial [Chloroflexi bacterium]|nr:GreA/GreB family elongation factor [Chloroflexota bacterium]